MENSCRRLSAGLIGFALLMLACGCTRHDDQSSLFQDDFDNPRSGWGADRREQFERGYADGLYLFDLYEPHWFAWAHPGQQYDDVSVEVDVSLASGSPDSHFGLLCRHVDLGSFYYFAISADGSYAIFRREDGGDLEILTADGRGMVPSAAVRTGGELNHVRAVCEGSELSLYVNDELVDTVTDDANTRGDVGIAAGSGVEGDALVQFDNFRAARP
jgi:hypothetical protein